MTWLTKLRTRLGHDEVISRDTNDESAHEAAVAFERAKAALDEAQERKNQVHEVTMSLFDLRTRNHFGEAIEMAMSRRERHE